MYSVIKEKTIQETFFDYVKSLEIKDFNYYAFGIQNTLNKSSRSLMSCAEWQKTFFENKFADHDPIRNAVFNTKRNVIFFNEVDIKDSLSKEIMQQRKKYDINNGIILVERHLGINFMFTVGTGFSKFDPSDYYVKKINLLKLIFNDFKLIMSPISEELRRANAKTIAAATEEKIQS